MSLSSYIRDDLTQRIRHSAIESEDLTLHALAEHYKVSPMPVRRAVAELIEQNILHKGGNGRLQINPRIRRKPPHKMPAPVAPPTDWSKVLLRNAIESSMDGEPVRWKIGETAERFGIGVNMVRTIFHQLAGQGILEYVPRRGWWIRPFQEPDLDAYLDVRVTLEMKALEDSRDSLDPEMLRGFLNANVVNGEAGPRIDNGLHQYWVSQCGNPYIEDFFSRHGSYYQALYSYAAIGNTILKDVARSHRAILRALLRKDFRAASAKLENDILFLRPILLEAIRVRSKASP